MGRLWLLVMLLAVGAWTIPAAPAVSEESPLAAAARKERERRAKLKDGSDKVLTDEDLGAGRPRPAPDFGAAEGAGESGTSGSGTSQAAGDAAPATSEPAPKDETAARRAEIQNEIDQQVERIRVVRAQVDAAERELADNVAPSLGPRRAQTMQIREDGLKAIADIEARIAELQAEAARLGVSVTRPAE